jgi:alanine-synthesizing transaminase
MDWTCSQTCGCVPTRRRSLRSRLPSGVPEHPGPRPSGGRLREQRDIAWELINDIPGLSAVKPRGALYLFAKIDAGRFNITDDERFIYDLLVEKKILLVQGTGFNWNEPDHFRIVFLPDREELRRAIHEIGDFLSYYRQA